jgi:WD40 repeat protein
MCKAHLIPLLVILYMAGIPSTSQAVGPLGDLIAPFLPPSPKILKANYLAFSPDGKSYVTRVGDEAIALYESSTGKQIRRLEMPAPDQVVDARFSPDGKMLALSKWGGPQVVLLDTATGKYLRTLEVHLTPDKRKEDPKFARKMGLPAGQLSQLHTQAFEFSPDGKWVVASIVICYCNPWHEHEEFCYFWNTATGKPLAAEGTRTSARVVAFAFSDDSKYFLAEFDCITNEEQLNERLNPETRKPHRKTWIELWDVATFKKIAEYGAPFEYWGYWSQWAGSRLRAAGIHGNGSFRIRLSPFGRPLVFPRAKTESLFLTANNVFGLKDTISGKVLCRFTNFLFEESFVHDVVLSGDDRMLAAIASKNGNGIVHLWDLSPLAHRQRLATLEWTPIQLKTLWEELAHQDLSTANRAFCCLFATPAKTYAFLKDRFRPVPQDQGDQWRRLLAELNHDKFAVRDKAYRQLEGLAADALPELVEALKASDLSWEQRVRMERLVEKLKSHDPSPEMIRSLCAFELLEQIDSIACRQLLQATAQGDPSAWITIEAIASLKRLNKAGVP